MSRNEEGIGFETVMTGMVYDYNCGCSFNVELPIDNLENKIPHLCPVHQCSVEHAAYKYGLKELPGPYFRISKKLDTLIDEIE